MPVSSVVLCVLCACASAPKIDFYTLGMESSGGTQPDVNLVVERLRTTEALARSQIMISASATEVEYYATGQWAGSVGETVQQKLTAEFGPLVKDRRTLTVSGTVLACEQVDVAGGAEARMKLGIVIRDPAKPRYEAPLLEKTYEARRSVSEPSSAAVVKGLSQCAERIAAEIAADAASL
ncbi:MAG: membrane integrity-associated transporter subunit PqiC [Acidobacteria bacterium]|nr:membrane integrity-associated transporter subunit PqiC [Candidatus Sulfomarinibacter sp. MAG AM2]